MNERDRRKNISFREWLIIIFHTNPYDERGDLASPH